MCDFVVKRRDVAGQCASIVFVAWCVVGFV